MDNNIGPAAADVMRHADGSPIQLVLPSILAQVLHHLYDLVNPGSAHRMPPCRKAASMFLR